MSRNIKNISLGSIFLTLTLVLGFTRIGYISIPTPAGAATIMHIPVILAGILLGPWLGALAGLMFGLSAVVYFSHIAPFWVLLPARPFIGIVAGMVYKLLSKYLEPHKKIKSYALIIISLVIFSFLYLTGVFIFNEWLSLDLLSHPIEYGFLISIVSFAISLILLFLIKDKEIKIIALGLSSFLGSLTNTIGTLGLAYLAKIFPIQVVVSIGILHGIPEAIFATIVCPPIVLALERAFKLRSDSQ